MPERYMGLGCLILLVMCVIAFVSLPPETKKYEPKNKIGDVVYLKLDNNKAQIIGYNEIYNYYILRTKTEAGYQNLSCEESEFTERSEAK
jgi:hypothetical protein